MLPNCWYNGIYGDVQTLNQDLEESESEPDPQEVKEDEVKKTDE